MRNRVTAWSAAAVCTLLGMLCLAPLAQAQPQSLEAVLRHVLNESPRVSAELANVRSIEKEHDLAVSAMLPRLDAYGDTGLRRVETFPGQLTDDLMGPKGFSIALSQPIFRGGRTVAGIDEAEWRILAAHEALRDVAQSTLLDAARAYLGVVRDRNILRLREEGLRTFLLQLETVTNQETAGVATKTDVARARSSKLRANSELSSARARLRASEAEYIRVVGQRPGVLRQPRLVGGRLPANRQEMRQAGEQHPSVLAAIYQEKASGYAVDKVRGELLPELSLEADYSQRFGEAMLIDRQETAKAKLKLRVPLFQGGSVLARKRQAMATREQRLNQVDVARRDVQASIATAWSTYRSEGDRIAISKREIESAKEQVDGVLNEIAAGVAVVADVLESQQLLIEARITMETVRHGRASAYFELLAASGRLVAPAPKKRKPDLLSGAERSNLYDPQ